MEKLKLHIFGKEDHLQELEKEFSQKLKAVENNTKMTLAEKEQANKKLRREHQRLKQQADFNLF